MKITDSAIKSSIREAKATGHNINLSDGHRLRLLVRPNGTAAWQHRFDFNGKETITTLGKFPAVSIAQARRLREANRAKIDEGINPNAEKREAETIKAAEATTFAVVAEQFINLRMVNAKLKRAPRTIDKARGHLRRYINPMIGNKPIAEVTDTDLLKILAHIESLGKIETAYKTRELLARIFRYAKAQKLCLNIVSDLEREALPQRPDNHLAAILERPKIGELLRAIESYKGQAPTQAALRLLPRLALRPGELRGGRWAEIDFKASVWRVPASRMKPVKGVREEHFVPLSHQALMILKGLHKITGQGEYLFPAIGPKRRPISENTLGAALATMGYDSNTQTPHGFRAIFRTVAAEDLELRIDWLELQLGHTVKDANGTAYNRASFLPQRTKLMQQWSDYLDQLSTTGARSYRSHRSGARYEETRQTLGRAQMGNSGRNDSSL